MKSFVTFFLMLFAISTRAQITLEHTYAHTGPFFGDQFGLVEVDSEVWKYIQNDYSDTIAIYNLDHSLERIIIIPPVTHDPSSGILIAVIAKNLFDLSGKYGYLLTTTDTNHHNLVRIYDEDGTLLFSLANCQLGSNWGGNFSSPIISTNEGTKMLIDSGLYVYHKVYSLPGKLPSCAVSSFASVTPSIANDPSLPTSAYPNPSSGLVHIEYQLPAGVSSGEVVLTDEAGREVKRYRVTSTFSDLEIQAADLPSGSYFYRVVTSEGESPAERIVLEK